ncbi:MAG: CoA-binding protein [Fimbriimonadaceae bacterium]
MLGASGQSLIERALSGRVFAVCGVSRDPSKFGYRVYSYLRAAGLKVYAVNPNAASIGSDPCYPSLFEIPERIDCVVAVTQPANTTKIASDCTTLLIPFIWMQPGAESEEAIAFAKVGGINVIAGGPCIMVEHRLRNQRNLD